MRFSLAVLALAAATITGAAPITYTGQLTGSGTFGSTGFTDQLVTFVFEGDTANVTLIDPGVYLNSATSATVAVAGIGQGTFTNSVAVWVNQGTLAFVFMDYTWGLPIAVFDNTAFSTYDLSTAIGPLAVAIRGFNPAFNFPTDAGNFTLTSMSGSPPFSAKIAGSEVPEPSSAALAGIGVALAALYRRRRANR
jgi:hypothetical protein